MDHPQPIEIIEYLAGRLGPEQAAALDAHLSACPPCRARLVALRQDWQRLEAHRPPAPPPAPTHAILAAIAASRPPAILVRPTHGSPSPASRGVILYTFRRAAALAAAIVLAAAVGHFAGRLHWPAQDAGTSTSNRVRPGTFSPDLAVATPAHALGLDHLAAPRGESLAAAIFDAPPAAIPDAARKDQG